MCSAAGTCYICCIFRAQFAKGSWYDSCFLPVAVLLSLILNFSPSNSFSHLFLRLLLSPGLIHPLSKAVDLKRCNCVGIQHFPLIFITSRFSHSYLFLLKCCFLKEKKAAPSWFHTEDLLCNRSSAVINTSLCCFSSPFVSHTASLACLSFPLPFPVSFSHCVLSS